jgi:hypothetical protein
MHPLRRASLWTIGIVAALVVLAAVTLPHLRRAPSGIAQSREPLAALAPMASYHVATYDQKAQPAPGGVIGGVPGGEPHVQPFDKKIIRNAELALIVQNVDEASAKIRNFTLQQKGEIDQVRGWSPSEHTREGELHVRVAADELESALKQFKSVALSVTNEQLSATDVTRQYADNDARMRSLQAEEQQYLQILKQAKSVQDVLDVTEKLTDVRTQIEQLQAEINVMSHDIAMSAVAITLSQNAPEGSALGSWHPLVNARRSIRNMVESVGDWVDSIISIVIYLPVMALWLLTIGAILLIAWKVFRLIQRR